MKSVHNSLRFALLATATLSLSAHATNGYQLIGVGAYQKSLGGAVTAAPGSAMTAVSNPAGMTRVGARADFSMEAFMPERTADFEGMGGDASKSAVDMYGVPAIGWTAPTSDGSDVYFGGGMYGTSGMGVDYAMTGMAPGYYTDPSDPGTFQDDPLSWTGYSNISFWQMAPGFAWSVDERLSVGATLNIDYQSVAFKQRVTSDSGMVMQNFDLSRGASGFGLGLGLGVLYDVNDQLTLGFNYKSKQQFDALEYQLGFGDISNGPGEEGPAGTYELDLDFPQQAAAGIAFRASPVLTVSADVKWIEWSDTMDKLAVKGPNGFSMAMDPGWEDQTVYALGVAYAVNPRMNLRVGYNYAESPFGEDKVSSNLILPAIVETHYTAGMDYRLNNHWELALHAMYVPEKSMSAPADDPMEISLSETSMGMNVGYRF
ncbi:MAG: outer membrane protein transport protein [Gammaproteobacteria bacterium]|nr:outer membrane protein transport protein [Gammaproteobacteria bacterium]